MLKTARTGLVALVGALVTACAPLPTTIGPAWFACKRNAQCTLVQDPAECVLIPVNRRYAAAYSTQLHLRQATLHRSKSCTRPGAEYSAICADSQCSSRRDPSRAPRRSHGGEVLSEAL